MKHKRLQSQTKENNKRKKHRKKTVNNMSKILQTTDFERIYQEFIKDLPKEALRVSVLEKGVVLALFGY